MMGVYRHSDDRHLKNMQWIVHSPSPFIQQHRHHLLPSWSHPVLSMLIVLQRCQIPLTQHNLATEAVKDRLRQQFLELGNSIASTLHEMSYLADLFDPKTGLPMLSPPGSLTLDDVAVVRATLGYATVNSGKCAIIQHPVWGTCVYPAILMSSAHPDVLAQVVERSLGVPVEAANQHR